MTGLCFLGMSTYSLGALHTAVKFSHGHMQLVLKREVF